MLKIKIVNYTLQVFAKNETILQQKMRHTSYYFLSFNINYISK